jgi:hypothetical protein
MEGDPNEGGALGDRQPPRQGRPDRRGVERLGDLVGGGAGGQADRHRAHRRPRPPAHLRQTLPQERRDLEQIKFLFGHSSIQTTERYLGSEQDLAVAVNDTLGL